MSETNPLLLLTAELLAAKQNLANLIGVQASGVKRIAQGDEMLIYAEGAELEKAIARWQSEIARIEALLGLRTPVRAARRVVFIAGKGL